MLRTLLLTAVIGLLGPPEAWGQDEPRDSRGSAGRMVGTWVRTRPVLPEGFRHIKHITPTHFVWVYYRVDEKAAVAVAGGSCSLNGDTYTERVEYATDGHEYLRGKEYAFRVAVERDSFSQKSLPGTDLEVDEVWKRLP